MIDSRQIQKQLKTVWLGKKINAAESVDSTNNWAIANLSESKRGEVFLAEVQTAGHGRMGRKWESKAGQNILMSFPDFPPANPAKAHQLTLVAGVACREAISKIANLSPQLKWPNDILISGKKAAGILLESRGDRVVIGIGINVNSGKEHFSEEIRSLATSLLIESGKNFVREELIAECLNAYEKWRDAYDNEGLAPVAAEWTKYSALKDKKIKIVEGDQSTAGFAEGLDNDGFLMVKVDGVKRRVISGDVIICA